MTVYDKSNSCYCEVYDITYDSSGYPHFLIYENGQWLRKSAKHFIPQKEYIDMITGELFPC